MLLLSLPRLAHPSPLLATKPRCSTKPRSWRRWAIGGLRGRFSRRRRRTPAPSRSRRAPVSTRSRRRPLGLRQPLSQPPSASGDDRSSAAVEPAGRRTRSKSNRRPPPPPTAPKKVSWAVPIPVADAGKEDSKQRQVPNAKMRTRTQPSRRGKGAAGEASNASATTPGNFDREIQPCMQPTHTEVEQQLVGTRGQRCPNKGKGKKEAQRRSNRQEPSGRENLSRALVPASVRKSTRRKSGPFQWWRLERMVYGPVNEDDDMLAGAIGILSYSPGEDSLSVKSFLA